MPRVIRPPTPPRLPAKLPLEDEVDAALTRLAQRIEHNRLTARLEELRGRFPEIDSVEFPTPLGTFRTPHLALPEATPPRIDARRREVVKAAALDDLAGLVEKIPVVGAVAGFLADAVEDLAMAKIQDTLTPQEKPHFLNADKVSPSTTLAALWTFAKVR